MQIGENVSLAEDDAVNEGGAEAGVDVEFQALQVKIQLVADDGGSNGAVEHTLFETGVGGRGGGTGADCGTPGPADIQGHETVPDADLVNILVQQFSEPDCTCPLHTVKYLH